jgi:hypothetical protein
LLVGGDKSGVSEKKFYKKFLKKADALYDAHLQRVKNRKAEQQKGDGKQHG